MLFLQLYWEFFKVGLFAIGGGLATVPFLYEMGERTGWFTAQTVADMIAVSESTPGPIGINMATYVGFNSCGVFGGAVATLGLITPSIIVILIVAAFLKSFRDNKYVSGAFYGLRPASTGLIAASGLSVAILCLINKSELLAGNILGGIKFKALILGLIILALTRWVKPTKKLHPLVFIAISALVGIVFRFGGV